WIVSALPAPSQAEIDEAAIRIGLPVRLKFFQIAKIHHFAVCLALTRPLRKTCPQSGFLERPDIRFGVLGRTDVVAPAVDMGDTRVDCLRGSQASPLIHVIGLVFL